MVAINWLALQGHAPTETERSQPDLFGLQKGWCPSERYRRPTNRPGHDLHIGIDPRSRFSKCSPAGGSVISLPRQGPNPSTAR